MICRVLLLISLTSCVSAGSFVVNVTQSSYQAEENHNITLEWTFTTKPDSSPKYLIIICEMIKDHEVSVLYHIYDGVEVSQDEKFSGRVQSDKDSLREGRIRLQLCKLRPDDSGHYWCAVNTDYGFSSASCRLDIIATSDQQQPQRTTSKPTQRKTGFFIGLGLSIALLVSVVFAFSRMRKKEVSCSRVQINCSSVQIDLWHRVLL